MFTGIVTGIGQITHVQALGDTSTHGRQLRIATPAGYLQDVQIGDSIAINGACMTVTALDATANTFTVDVSSESLARTTGLHEPGEVNLEKALRAHDRLGGHIVSGHVDGIGTVTALTPKGESHCLQIAVPHDLAAFMTYKGSVTVQGVSLTINQVQDSPTGCTISINLIPHTMEHTTLRDLQSGSPVNLEIDMLARYVQRMLGLRGQLPVHASMQPPA
ncbi:MAG: riboflavin synthase [Brachymonas sp.]|nr:riboflavin synthase [Brachymonas sp.]